MEGIIVAKVLMSSSLSVGAFLHFTLLQLYPCYYDLHIILFPTLVEYEP
jgi:hypothetical protein